MSKGSALGNLGLDRMIHEKSRLMTLTYLASSDSPETPFTELRDALGMTAGNLSIHLKNLEEAGYVEIGKSFRGNKPNTAIRLTVSGRQALELYMSELEVILASVRKAPLEEK